MPNFKEPAAGKVGRVTPCAPLFSPENNTRNNEESARNTTAALDHHRSAGFQPAVSQVSNLLPFQPTPRSRDASSVPPITDQRYTKFQTGAAAASNPSRAWISKCLIFLLLPLLALGLFTAGCAKSGGTASAQRYHCPMHPTYITNKPGDCPICGMKLVPIKDDKPASASPASPAKPVTTYTCPMHPNVVSNAPGKCPECGMKLVPAKTEPPAAHTNAPSSQGHEGHTAAASGAAPAVPGRIAITLSADKQQMIGLRLSTVERRELTQIIRTTATFEHDETRYAKIAPRFGGWVRDLKVNFTGQVIQKGQPLLTVYSPELLSAESEYLLAYQRFDRLKQNPGDPQLESAKRLADSGRRKLALWQISDEEISEMERTGKPQDELLVRAPVSGHVVAKTAVEGKAFMAGETLYEIADMMHLWVRAYVFEFEAPLIKVGQKARITLPYLGNKTYESTVTFLYPHIEPQTRRAEIRLEVENPRHELRPAMWANVELEASYGEVLVAPASAVLDTGTRYVAFVQRADEHLEPRDVKIGAKTDDYWQVLDGLKVGDKVVTRALFLVDSESQLKAAISGMGALGGQMGASGDQMGASGDQTGAMGGQTGAAGGHQH